MSGKKMENPIGTLKKKKRSTGKRSGKKDQENTPIIEPAHFRSISPSFFSRLAANSNSNTAPSKQVAFSGLKDSKNRDEEDTRDSEGNISKDHTGLVNISRAKKVPRQKKSRSMSVQEARAALSLSHTPLLKVISLDEPQSIVPDQPVVGKPPQPPNGSNSRIGLESDGKQVFPGTSTVYRRRAYSTCSSCVK